MSDSEQSPPRDAPAGDDSMRESSPGPDRYLKEEIRMCFLCIYVLFVLFCFLGV